MLLSFQPVSVLQDQLLLAMQPAPAGKRATTSSGGKGPDPGGTALEEGLLSWDCGQLAGQVAWLSGELSARGYLCESLPSGKPAALATAQLAHPLAGLLRLKAGQVHPLPNPFDRIAKRMPVQNPRSVMSRIRCTPGSEAQLSCVSPLDCRIAGAAGEGEPGGRGGREPGDAVPPEPAAAGVRCGGPAGLSLAVLCWP